MPVSKAQALEKTTDIVKRIAEKGKIDLSCGEEAPTAGVKKQGQFGDEWVVSFDNPKVDDKTKQTL